MAFVASSCLFFSTYAQNSDGVAFSNTELYYSKCTLMVGHFWDPPFEGHHTVNVCHCGQMDRRPGTNKFITDPEPGVSLVQLSPVAPVTAAVDPLLKVCFRHRPRQVLFSRELMMWIQDMSRQPSTLSQNDGVTRPCVCKLSQHRDDTRADLIDCQWQFHTWMNLMQRSVVSLHPQRSEVSDRYTTCVVRELDGCVVLFSDIYTSALLHMAALTRLMRGSVDDTYQLSSLLCCHFLIVLLCVFYICIQTFLFSTYTFIRFRDVKGWN